MHKCVRCERAATTIEEINEGCPCGSKVFVFIRDANSISEEAGAKQPGVSQVAEKPQSLPPLPTDGAKEKESPSPAGVLPSGENEKMPDVVSEGLPHVDFSPARKESANSHASSAAPAQTASEKSISQENGKAPSAYFARTTFTADDVENIKIVTEGVFAVDINALSKNPVVLKDEEGVYYVRLPLDSKGRAEKPNGKKK